MVAVTHPLSDPAQGLQTEHPLLEDGTPHETEELGQSVSRSLWEGGGRERGEERGGEGWVQCSSCHTQTPTAGLSPW